MKLPKIDLKLAVPVFIMVIFMSSIFVVFSSGGLQGHKAKLVVDFGQPGLYFEKEVAFAGNETNALKLLSSYSPSIELQAGQIYCIVDYCNTNVTKWYFYTADNMSIESLQKLSPEECTVKNSDNIIFRYETIKNSTN